jgi:hypothetical protein
MAEILKSHMLNTLDYNPLINDREIQMLRGELADASRDNRTVPYKIYLPEGLTAPAPVIVWSHGLGGSRDGAGFLSRHLAGRGYVVIHVQHQGTDSSLWEGKPGHPWDVIRATHIPRKATLQRYLDVPFLLDSFDDLETRHPDLIGKLDRAVMGMSGHSFGALTTQIMAGQYLMREDASRKYDLYEPRFKAGILYSPVPVWKYPDAAHLAYQGIRMPLFHMTGTDDLSPIEGFGHELRVGPYNDAGTGDQYLLVLKDGDHMVYNGSRGKLGDNPLREHHEALIMAGAAAYWDTMLKNDAAAKTWLENGGYQSMLSADDQFTFRRN